MKQHKRHANEAPSLLEVWRGNQHVYVFCSTNTSSCKSGVQWQWHTGKTDSGTEVIRGGQGTGREERESSRFNIPEVFLPSNADRPMEDNEQVRMPTIH